jgi:hypothetical protein
MQTNTHHTTNDQAGPAAKSAGRRKKKQRDTNAPAAVEDQKGIRDLIYSSPMYKEQGHGIKVLHDAVQLKEGKNSLRNYILRGKEFTPKEPRPAAAKDKTPDTTAAETETRPRIAPLRQEEEEPGKTRAEAAKETPGTGDKEEKKEIRKEDKKEEKKEEKKEVKKEDKVEEKKEEAKEEKEIKDKEKEKEKKEGKEKGKKDKKKKKKGKQAGQGAKDVAVEAQRAKQRQASRTGGQRCRRGSPTSKTRGG